MLAVMGVGPGHVACGFAHSLTDESASRGLAQTTAAILEKVQVQRARGLDCLSKRLTMAPGTESGCPEDSQLACSTIPVRVRLDFAPDRDSCVFGLPFR